MKRLCWKITDLAFPIELHQTGKDNFTVIYGVQVRKGLTYSQACTELGASILHALSCNGKVDNRRKGEK